MSKSNRKVYQFTKDGIFIAAHKSTTKAASIMGCDESTIRKSKDTNRFAMGFAWRSSRDFDAISCSNNKNSMPKILVFDLESAPNSAYVWSMWKQNIYNEQLISTFYLLSWSAKWLYSDETMSDRLTSREAKQKNDKRIVGTMRELLDQAQIVIAHNCVGFDVPKLNTRMIINGFKPVSPYKQIDTLLHARKEFGFVSNKLDSLAELFGFGNKIKTSFELWERCVNGDNDALEEMRVYNVQDVILLEKVYLKMRPFMKNHPNIALYIETDEELCPICGSSELVEDGFVYTSVGKYPSLRCKCGAYGKRRKNVYTKELRSLLLAPIGR